MKQSELTLGQKIGIVIIALTGPALALLYWSNDGFLGWPIPLLYTVAAVGGAIGMAIYAPPPIRRLGMISGVLMGLGSFGFHLYYSTFRSSMWNYESALVGCIGATPGMLLYWGGRKRMLLHIQAAAQASGVPVTQDTSYLESDPFFQSGSLRREVFLPAITPRLRIIGFAFVACFFLISGVLLMFNISEYQTARAYPEFKVVTCTQFMQEKPRTGLYQIKDCRLDLREAIYTVHPPDPESKSDSLRLDAIYIPIHADNNTKEKTTDLLLAVSFQSNHDIWMLMEEVERIRSAHPDDALTVLNAKKERFTLKLDLKGMLKDKVSVYPQTALEQFASIQPPVSSDFVILDASNVPSLNGAIEGIKLGIGFGIISIVFLVLLLRWRRRAKASSGLSG